MFNSPVLDLVILLSFTYFIGSLILSAINEALAGTLRLRQADLKKGIYRFFLSPSWRQFVKHRFFESPSIQTLMREKHRLPAYIPAKNFVLAITEYLDAEAYQNGSIRVLDKNKKPVTNPNHPEEKMSGDGLPQDLVTVLETIMKQVAVLDPSKRIGEFEKRVEEFYNLTMDRVTGWYKRRVRRILLALGIILSIALNIDTIKIANDAMSDKDKLTKTVDNIAANMTKLEAWNAKGIVIRDTLGQINIRPTATGADSLGIFYQQTTGYKLGYASLDDFKNQWSSPRFFLKLLGVLLTAFALQLGSNYWFDLMNKAVNVRATGRKPDAQRPAPKP